ncbi:MAG: protein-export chaperone SecB [Pseudomonadota bacterium]|nr:protein-export chaperone SecB [Alphaproteobacteria bacterium]MDO4424122.1 protein-export chaperone SecB [Pseudomonadota bacterium]
MAKFNIISQFLKDISFESPNVPELFFKNDNGQAKLEINIDIQIKGADNNLFMVDVITKVHSKLEAGEKSIFLIESTYSGLVQLEGETIDEEDKKRTLLIDVPTLLFPAVRALVTRLTSESGFPTFTMQPVDFAQLYEQKQAQ